MQASGPAAVLVKSHGDFVFWVQRSASMVVGASDRQQGVDVGSTQAHTL